MRTPTQNPPRLSVALSPQDVDASERELLALLQQALAPSFVLVRRLGAGGMGIVYLARDPSLKRLVAVKVMLPDLAHDPDSRARFQREAEAVAAISHPNVVAVHAVGTLANGIPYLVMQYVNGPTMAERLSEEGPLDLESAKQIIGEIASALDAAHRKGIIHRDIKAANILWDDAAGRAIVSDFGIAAVLDRDFDSGTLRLTQTGAVMGTPKYMSPEQLLSEPVTAKTDIYSLGLLGYELLTGEGPYQATSPNQIVAAHLRDLPRPLSVMRPDVDPELESLLGACLEKDAHGRPSGEDIARRLRHGASILLEWPPPGLEDLHGAIARPLRMMLFGSFAIAVPVTLVATMGRDSAFSPGWPQVLALPSIAAIGGLTVLLAMVDGMRLLREAIRAARAGYGWGIIAEVLADTEKNTGSLVSGEREYAALSPDQRAELRRGRVQRVGLKLGAAIWAVAGFFVTLPVATRFGGAALLAYSSLGIPLILLFAARTLAWREWRMLRGIRARLRDHRTPLTRLSQLAATWKDSFDRVLSGVGLGQGTMGKVKRRATAIIGVTAIAAAGAVSAYGLMMASVMGEVSQAMRIPKFSSVTSKFTKLERFRALRPPIDPAITPLQAGYAFQSIANAGRTGSRDRLETPTKDPIPAIALFGGDKREVAGPWSTGSAIRAAAKGVSAEQRRFLEKAAGQPGDEQFSLLARARSIDWVSAFLVNPLPDGTVFHEVPLPRLSLVKNKAYSRIAAAALALADGRPAEAERVLRENIGVGFAMMESPTLIENLIGAVIVGATRTELVALYEVTGRSVEARAFSAESDPVLDETAREVDPARMSPEARDAYFQALIRDKRQPRGLRFEIASGFLAYQPCGDLRQMLFGPNELYASRMKEARNALVRTSGEDQLMRLAERALESVVTPEDMGIRMSGGHRSLMAFAKAVDALSGAKRVQACSSIMPLSY